MLQRNEVTLIEAQDSQILGLKPFFLDWDPLPVHESGHVGGGME